MRGVNVAAVVLAAGASRRLGRAKQALVFDGETLLARAVRVACDAGLVPVIVVVRDVDAELAVEGARVVVNVEAAEGMAASIRVGVRHAWDAGAGGVVVMSCDQVGLGAAHLRALVEDVDRVTGSRYAGRVGIPAYFPVTAFEKLLELRGDAGARELLRDAVAVVNEVLALDIDTEEDVARARELFEDRRKTVSGEVRG